MKGDKTINDEDKEKANTIYGLLEKFLEGRKWIAGDSITLADFSLVPTVSSYNLFVPIDAGSYPKLTAWLDSAKESFLNYDDINVKGLEIIKSAVF